LWINLAALVGLALAQEGMRFDAVFVKTLGATFVACAFLAAVAIFGRSSALALGAHFGALANLVALTALALVGALVYAGVLLGALRASGVTIASLRR
jgi:putative peptidoglycan lipid II flippase